MDNAVRVGDAGQLALSMLGEKAPPVNPAGWL